MNRGTLPDSSVPLEDCGDKVMKSQYAREVQPQPLQGITPPVLPIPLPVGVHAAESCPELC